MKKTTPRLFTAIHEAKGHALLDWIFGNVLLSITVVPRRLPGEVPCEGRVRSRRFGNSGAVGKASIIPSDALNPASIFPLLAGRAATDFFLPNISSEGTYAEDWSDVESLLAVDADSREILNWRLQNPNGTVEEFYQAFKNNIFNFYRSKKARRAAEALSNELMKRGTLSGRAAVTILEKAWGKPLPPRAIPAEKHGSLTDEGPQNFTDLVYSIQAHVDLLRKYVNHVRDSGSEHENLIMDELGNQLTLLKLITLPPLDRKSQ